MELVITSGHEFPGGDFLFQDRLFHTVLIKTPDDTILEPQVSEDGDHRIIRFIPETPGMYLARFVLKKPQMEEPLYWGQTVFTVGKKIADTLKVEFGSRLEIVLEFSESVPKTGNTIHLAISTDGQSADGTVAIMPEGKKTTYLTVAENRKAEYRLKYPGYYLLTTHLNGKTCSLTFRVTE